MPPLTMMDCPNQEWGLVMLTSCPRCQHTFRPPCGPSCPSFPAAHPANVAHVTHVVNVVDAANVHPAVCLSRCTILHTTAPALSCGGCLSTRSWDFGTCGASPRSPDPSPLAPLSFALPPPPINPKVPIGPVSPVSPRSVPALHDASDLDLQRLSLTLRRLKASGWYYEGLTWQESITLLSPTSPGTFLVRESSNPSYLFSMSVQAEKGPTSVRVHYVSGYFRLDAEPSILPAVPLFDCVVKMVEYYIYSSQQPKSSRDLVFLDRSGSQYSSILLKRPLLRRPPTLQHLARLKVNQGLRSGETDPKSIEVLPATLKDYLQEYPYTQ